MGAIFLAEKKQKKTGGAPFYENFPIQGFGCTSWPTADLCSPGTAVYMPTRQAVTD